MKTLKLSGFKSFADRARLELRPGVTVVVGPNGSGKSNLVDALSWVLGTQSNRALRTNRMEEVIFAGTASRPSLGKAEVTLVIDNTERMIDLDLDEVSITRRLYRDGSSDYELNGVACRLLDIQDLLSDSGVGRHQHVIIGQGEIGEVLSASAEDHRAVIEEAAGILKHRRRKERAERRLERTDEDVVRLQDILGELNRQMRPLRRQARAAGQYDELKAEVVSLRLYLAGRRVGALDEEAGALTAEKAALAGTIDTGLAKIEELGAVTDRLSGDVIEVGGELDRDTTAAALLETTIERLRRASSIAHERIRAITGMTELSEEREADLGGESESIGSELADIDSHLDEARREAVAAEALFRRLEDEERALAGQAALPPEGALAAVRGEMTALQAALARDRRELEAVEHRREVLASRAVEERDEVETIDSEIRAADSALVTLQDRYAESSRQRKKRQEEWEGAEEQLAAALTAQAVAGARLEAAASVNTTTTDPASREAAEGAAGVLGAIVQVLSPPPELSQAIEAALGPWVGAVAFDSRDAARRVAETIKTSGLGALHLVAPAFGTEAPARDVARETGLDALVDLIGDHSRIAVALLGDVVVVEGWSAGWDLVDRYPGVRAVTPEGDLITTAGMRLSGSVAAGRGAIESAEEALERAEIEMARAKSRHTAARRAFESARDAERLHLEELEAAESSLAGRTEAMDRLTKSAQTVESEAGRLEERGDDLYASIQFASEQLVVLRARVAALEGEEAERTRIWADIEERRRGVQEQRETVRSNWQEASEKARSIEERRNVLHERLRRIEDDLGRLHSDESRPDPSSLRTVEDVARRAVGLLDERLGVLRDRQAALRERHRSMTAELASVRTGHAEAAKESSAAKDRVAAIELRLTELRMQRESIEEAVRRDADAGLEMAMEAARPDYPENADLEGMLDTKLAQLSRLGPINPLAAAEFSEMDERHSFLTDQISDVEASRRDLRKVITALEDEIQSRFAVALEEVASAYERYFSVLFPGGRGRVTLVDSADQGSGVSIEAQPMGKRLSRMSLLSGGERSLAALAFLFAVFEARPSPFYVLDEVEAALDDANLRRFLRIVEEFRARAQLIVVTHQQQTMEAADVLYGVTMEPGGSSRVLRKDMALAARAPV